MMQGNHLPHLGIRPIANNNHPWPLRAGSLFIAITRYLLSIRQQNETQTRPQGCYPALHQHHFHYLTLHGITLHTNRKL